MGRGKRETILEWCENNGELGKRMYEGMLRASHENEEAGIVMDNYYPQTTKVFMRCEKGHLNNYKIQSIRQGAWCRQCAMGSANKERFEREVSTGQRQSLYEWCMQNGLKGKMILDAYEKRRKENEQEGLYLNKIAANSNKTKLHLRCENGHDFDNYVYQVTAHDGWCPVCAALGWGDRLKESRLQRNGSFYDWIIGQGEYGKRILEAFDRCKELNKGIDLKTMNYNSRAAKLWLSCGNPTHRPWLADTADLTRGRWCPYCTHKTSYPEQVIYNWCSANFNNVQNRARITHNNITKEADIYIPELKLVIEYQGEFYHKGREEQDKFKEQFFKSNGYREIQVFESKKEDTIILPDGNIRHNCFKDSRCMTLIQCLVTLFNLSGVKLKQDKLTIEMERQAKLFLNK